MAETTIPVSHETQDQLKRLAYSGETYDEVIRRLIGLQAEIGQERGTRMR
ncbi:MAG: hypothetical protein KY455_00690 [Euryarchaeota archaeon]|nr:hypothetical protein [Euryarchaeota archaeon]